MQVAGFAELPRGVRTFRSDAVGGGFGVFLQLRRFAVEPRLQLPLELHLGRLLPRPLGAVGHFLLMPAVDFLLCPRGAAVALLAQGGKGLGAFFFHPPRLLPDGGFGFFHFAHRVAQVPGAPHRADLVAGHLRLGTFLDAGQLGVYLL